MKLLPRSGAVGEEREESGEGAYSWVCKCCCVNAARGIHSLRNYAAALNTSSFLRQCVWSSEPGQSEMFVFPFFSAATWTLVALFSSLCYLWVLHCLLHLPSDTLMSLTLCYDTCTRRITLQDTFLFFSLLFFNQQQKNKTGTASGLIGSSNVWGSQDRDLGRLLELFTTLKRYSRGINCLLNWLIGAWCLTGWFFLFFVSVLIMFPWWQWSLGWLTQPCHSSTCLILCLTMTFVCNLTYLVCFVQGIYRFHRESQAQYGDMWGWVAAPTVHLMWFVV